MAKAASSKEAAEKKKKNGAGAHKHLKRQARKRACQVAGCKNPYRAKGYCQSHYQQWRKGGFGRGRYDTCSKEGCLKPQAKEGLCEQHWKEKRAPGAAAEAPKPSGETPVAPAAPAAPAAGTSA